MILHGLGVLAVGARSAVANLWRGRAERPIDIALPTVASAVEAAVESKLGCDVTHVSSEEVFQEKAARRKLKRRYVKHLLRAGPPADRDLVVFSRSGPQEVNEGVESFVSGLTLPELRVPRYYGHAATEEGDTFIWEFVSGKSPLLVHCSREQLRRIVRAVAAINASTADAVQRLPNLPVGTMRAFPVADLLRAALVSQGEIMRRAPTFPAALDRFAAMEEGALSRLATIGNRFFSHQDIASGNMLLPPAPNPPAVLDWESAAIAAPGVGLRRFATLDIDTQWDAAQHYVDYLETKGISVKFRDVLFVMRAAQVFCSLHEGVNRLGDAPKRAEKAIRWGLARAPGYFSRGLILLSVHFADELMGWLSLGLAQV